MSFDYLATPYTHEEPDVCEARYQVAWRVAARLTKASGVLVFSPIAHSHKIAEALREDGVEGTKSFHFWSDLDIPMICLCRKLIVVVMDGTSESKGIHKEVQLCETLGKEVTMTHLTKEEENLYHRLLGLPNMYKPLTRKGPY